MNAMTSAEVIERARARHHFSSVFKQMIVDRLDLDTEPTFITDDQPLFGRGLELDSVDALELSVGLEYATDVPVTDDDVGAFGSINALVDFIEERGGSLDEGNALVRQLIESVR